MVTKLLNYWINFSIVKWHNDRLVIVKCVKVWTDSIILGCFYIYSIIFDNYEQCCLIKNIKLTLFVKIIEVCLCSALLMEPTGTSFFLGIHPSRSTSTQCFLLAISSHSFQGATYRLAIHHLGRLTFYRNNFYLVSCKKFKIDQFILL